MIIALQTLVFFRETLLTALERAIQPYFKRVALAFSSHRDDFEEEEPEEQVFAEFDDERGVIFFPPMYAQRYAAVSDCLMDERWRGKLEKVVDFGYHDISFIKYLREVPGITRILGVDIESMFLRCSSDLFDNEECTPAKRESPLQVILFQGNAADPDFRLIGCDAVIAIEMIEHMLPHDLDRLVHNVFGFIKPWIVIFTTPNGDFNVLFKALEKNGLRRLDHFFEWSREQFNDWCSNIIVRYPHYTVNCQGIGPGPPGTDHHGCCSQLALFVNKDYQKQQDLNMNSLALVQHAPNPKALTELVDCWENTENAEICTQTTEVTDDNSLPPVESFTELLYTDDPSCMRLPASPTISDTITHPFIPLSMDNTISAYIEQEYLNKSDKILQCNLDTELGKNFLMFDEYQCLDVRVPRRAEGNRVYEIEDVASRLNCSTLQVKKFSKTTQNLMARNKIESLVHTREVVDGIRNLTKTLKINNCDADRPEDSTNIWCNINWGDNAPYWNKFYAIVGEYNYPVEAQSDECRILDLITDEINRMIDTHFEEVPCNINRLEIPMSHLMTVVQHITDDIDMVRDLLEWNGYEIVDDVVVHSRFVLGTATVATHDEDSQDIETNFSDWDNITEVRSTTLSEGSTIVPDYHDRCLRRALNHKVRDLRTMLTADEDITTELDKVISRLMKLALRTCKDRTTTPPLKWMQCKLLDLLTLTEKAIEYRKKHLIENSWKAIEFGDIENNLKMTNLTQDDIMAKKIVNKYRHIISPADTSIKSTSDLPPIESATSLEFMKDLEYADQDSPHEGVPPTFSTNEEFESVGPDKTELNSIEKTKAWLNVDVEVVPSHNQDVDYANISSEDTYSMYNVRHKQKRQKHQVTTSNEVETTVSGTPPHKTYKSKREDKKKQTSSTRVTKKVARNCAKISGHCNNKFSPVNYPSCIVRSKKISKENRCLTMRASKPIPESLINLCHPELKVEKCIKEFNVLIDIDDANKIVISNKPSPIVSIEDNTIMDIIINDTQVYDTQETLAYKSIGTDVEEVDNADMFDKEDPIENLSNDIDLNLCTRHEVSTENIYAQTIFLNDINEPSTSKGIRHNIGMDVQCGPDTLAAYPMLSASTSLVRLPPAFPGIKIHDGITDSKPKGKDFGTTTQDTGNDIIITPRSRSVGIKIKDSDVNICTTNESYTMTQMLARSQNQNPGSRCCSPCPLNPLPRSWSPESSGIIPENPILIDSNKSDCTESSFKTELLKPISDTLKTEDSGSEICMSPSNFQKSYPLVDSSKNTSEILSLTPSKHKDNNVTIENMSNMKCSKPKLCCGGIDVHSYKDKQESVDIVYQGEWQQYRLKAGRKKTYNIVYAKKINDSVNRKQKDTIKEKRVNSKEKLSIRKLGKREIKMEPSKPSKMSTDSNENKKMNSTLPKKIIKDAKNTNRPLRPSVNVSKVSSKLGMCSITSKNVKSAFTAKKPQITATVTVKKDDCAKNIKSYIPLYLQKRRRQITEITEKRNLNKSMDSADDLKIETTKNKNLSLVRSKTGEIRKDLLKFGDNVTNKTYMVFHNKKQENCSSTDKQQITNDTSNENNTKQDDPYIKRPLSPQSLNSSTCSSLNSIATVRAVTTKTKNLANKKHSASSYKSSVNTSESENTTPTKTKKLLKRCKSARKSDNNKETNNKENIPDATENFASKETDKFLKSPFVGKHKNVCIAQLKTDRSSIETTTRTLSKHKTLNKSNIKIPNSEDDVERKRSLSMSPIRKRSLKCETSSINNTKISNPDMSQKNAECENMVLELKPQELTSLLSEPQNVPATGSVADTVENSLLTAWIQNLHYGSQSSSEMNNYMRDLLEDLLEFVDVDGIMDSGPVGVRQSDQANSKVDLNESACSFKTVTTTDNLNHNFTESDIENSLNQTFESVLEDDSVISLAGTRRTVTDLDLLSFTSTASISKHSEYYLADSDLNAAISSIEYTPAIVINPTSVTDIFERKESITQKTPGVLANQAFSGFSLDGEPVTGDQPDPIALIDSETGSMAMGIGRLANSEELFISGRSSESYESCLIDEDAVVPNWLFQIISQQQSEVADNQPLIVPQMPMMDEPRYDINGNAVEPGIVGVDAGAGDGRGIHSDQSQDSSGRGTSLSSTETSSSHLSQNEDVVIEPLGFLGQFELLRNVTISSDVGNAELRDASPPAEHRRSMEDNEGVAVSSHSRRRPRTQFNVVSDIDADVSSIDTDILPDSSDNN